MPENGRPNDARCVAAIALTHPRRLLPWPHVLPQSGEFGLHRGGGLGVGAELQRGRRLEPWVLEQRRVRRVRDERRGCW